MTGDSTRLGPGAWRVALRLAAVGWAALVSPGCLPETLTSEQLDAVVASDAQGSDGQDATGPDSAAPDALAADGSAADAAPTCPPTCDDGNPCTADACGPAGTCQHQAAAGSCDDGDPCTEADTCSGTTCSPGTPIKCDDGNPCTSDLCEAGAGCKAVPTSTPCDDGLACTTGDTCSGGLCKGLPKAWQAVIGSKYSDHGTAVVAHTDGGAVATGRNGGNVEDDFWLARYAADGELLWEKTFGEPDTIESAYGLAAMSTGGWLMVGHVGTSSDADGRAVRTDGTGKLLWVKDVGSKAADELRGVVGLGDGGAVAVGVSAKSGLNDLWLVRFDGQGGVAWQAYLGGAAPDSGQAVTTASGGGLLAVGSTSASGSTDALVVRTDANGNPLWQKILGENTHAESATAVARAPGGGYLVAGIRSITGGSMDMALWHVTDSGQVAWSQLWGGPDIEVASGVVTLADGFLVAGKFVGTSSAKTDGLLVRFDPLGNFLWKKVYGGTGSDSFTGIAPLPNGYALVGDAPQPDNSAGLWLVRTDPWGNADCFSAGQCKAACNSGSACKASWCDLGACVSAPLPEGSWCQEGACLTGTCDAKKVCQDAVAVSCDDGNPCTQDGCQANAGCTHAQQSDGTPCATGSVCKAGVCAPGQ